jgi:zinc transport system substrate-binding protein
MDKRKGIVIGVLLAAVFLIAVSATYIYIARERGRVADDGKIGVVVTILPQAEFVEKVGGDKVHVTLMVPPGASPHVYEPTTSQLMEVSDAKMYAMVGSGVEFELVQMEKLIEINRDMLVVDTSEGVTLMGKDPHIWNSPVNAKIMVENICEGLIEVDPENADFYTQNKNNYLKELDILDGYIHYKLDGFTNRVFLIYHPAFGYFATEYNLTQLPVEHGGKEPTPKVIQDCIDKARQYNLQYVFVAPQFATEHCEIIANEIGGQTASMDPLAKNYISNMGRIADSLALEFAT